MVDEKNLTEQQLDDLFTEAGARPGAMPDALFSRIVADADANAMARPRRIGLGEWLGGFVGDWFQVARVATLGLATAAGVWVGYAPPSGLADFNPIGQEEFGVNDFLFSIDAILEEG